MEPWEKLAALKLLVGFDPLAIAAGQEGQCLLMDCSKPDFSPIPFQLQGLVLIIVDTKTPRSLAHSSFNDRQQQCQLALADIQKQRPIQNLCQARLDDLQHISDEVLKARARHVITEQARVLTAVDLLKNDRGESFGELLTQSHRSLQRDYEVSCHELDTAVAAAVAHPSCLGARMTGAGFGGCALALIHEKDWQPFSDHIRSQFKEIIGHEPGLHLCRPSAGARPIA